MKPSNLERRKRFSFCVILHNDIIFSGVFLTFDLNGKGSVILFLPHHFLILKRYDNTFTFWLIETFEISIISNNEFLTTCSLLEILHEKK